ncbi:MAG: shikimate kinase [Clostridia bacterium]|nr:shikimate kinase [Clostridia bacterium]
MSKSNIVLIGMPSSGKSTIGKVLSQALDLPFVDTDTVILNKENRPLREIVNTDGLAKFLEIQENTILEMDVDNHIVATGGGVVYSEAAIRHLKGTNGLVVFLYTELVEIDQRITTERRFARNEGQSLSDLYNERLPLYRKYADLTIDCTSRQVEDIANEIIANIKGSK